MTAGWIWEIPAGEFIRLVGMAFNLDATAGNMERELARKRRQDSRGACPCGNPITKGSTSGMCMSCAHRYRWQRVKASI